MSEVPFDKVVLSCDENPLFLPFVPLIAKAWHKFFPEVGIELGFVCEVNPETGLPLDSRVYQYIRTMAERSKVNLTFLPLVEGVSPCNLGKVGRLIVAAEQGDAVCLPKYTEVRRMVDSQWHPLPQKGIYLRELSIQKIYHILN